MKNSKRLIKLLSVVLSLVILISSVGLSASAAGNTIQGYIEALPNNVNVSVEEYTEFMQQYGGAVSVIYSGAAQMQEEIVIKDFNIPLAKTSLLFATLYHTFPELVYVSSYSYRYYNNADNTLYSVYPQYINNSAEMKQQFLDKADELYLPLVNDDMDDFTKALILHDALVLNTYYPNLSQDPNQGSNYTYMVENWGVCQYYSECYAYLLAQNGIRSEVISSSDMNHAWLKIKLDGSYYNIDSTWDDYYPDRGGKSFHNYYLYSDAAFPEHSGYQSIHQAVSTQYDNYNNLHSIKTQLCYLGDTFYAIIYDNNNEVGRLVTYDPSDDSVRTLKTLDYIWRVPGSNFGYYQGNYSSLAAYNGKLYYNSPDAVYEYDPVTGAETQFAIGESGRVLYGLRVLDDQLWGYYANNPNGDENNLPPTPEYLRDMSIPYTVSVEENIIGGDVEASAETAFEGDIVTLTVTPDEDYKIAGVAVNGAQLEPVDGEYSFEMPAENVTVTATFIRKLFDGHSLSLKGDIGVNFYLNLSPEEAEYTTVNFTWDADGVTKTASADMSEAEHYAGGYKAVCDVAPAEMTCPITATVSINDEEQDDTDTFSAAEYADVILNDDSFAADYIQAENNNGSNGALRLEQLRNLVASMLNFGAAAQEKFNVNPNEPANAGLDVRYALSAVDAQDINVTASDMYANLDRYGLEYTGSTLICCSDTSIRHYYRIVNRVLFDTVRDDVTLNGAYAVCYTKDGEIYFEQKNISAADLDFDYRLTIGEDHYDYSAMNYVKSALQLGQTDTLLRTLATALYWYSQNANSYFGR